MELEQTISITIQVCTLLGIISAVYLSIRKPQEKSEVNDAVFDEKFDSLRDLVTNLRDNHIHTLDQKIDKHIENQSINEREVSCKLGGIEAKLDILLSGKKI